MIGENRNISHFVTDTVDVPDLNKFLSIYKSNLDDDFVLDYYIHLYTDYIRFKYFITDYIKETGIYDINNNKIKLANKIMK